MPKVGNKEYAYTDEGIAAAKKESADTGIPISNGAGRSQTMYAGGGQTGYNAIGNPMYQDGGNTDDSANISVYKKNRAEREKRKAEREKRRAERRERRRERKAKRQAERSKKIVKGKNIIPGQKDMHVYKEGEEGDVTYAMTGSSDKQQAKIVKDSKTKYASEKTPKGGEYKIYGKESKKAKSFRQAFKDAKGEDFTWNGKKYSGKTKEQEDAMKDKKKVDKPVKVKKQDNYRVAEDEELGESRILDRVHYDEEEGQSYEY